MKIKVYNIEGKEVEELTISDTVFGMKRNDDLIQQAYLAILGNQREVLAHTKNRGERAGSGIKPWRQKGTGRARVGSVRTPVWRKGGIAFGPRSDRNFTKKINKKMNAKAIAMVLGSKMKDGEMMVIDKMELPATKTKEMAKVFENLKLKGKTLVAFLGEERELRLTSRNLKKTENILTEQLNVADMLQNKNLLLSKNSVKYLEKKYGGKKDDSEVMPVKHAAKESKMNF